MYILYRHGTARHGHGTARHGKMLAWHGTSRNGHITEYVGTARLQWARHGMARIHLGIYIYIKVPSQRIHIYSVFEMPCCNKDDFARTTAVF